MRLFGKPVIPKNGYPWIGTVKLLKDASVKATAKGVIWQAFCSFESPRKGETDGTNTIHIKAYAPLSESLVPWAKGTVLFVAGALHKDDFWSKAENKEVYSLQCEYVSEQLDYTKMYGTDSEAEQNDGGSEEEADYDPGF